MNIKQVISGSKKKTQTIYAVILCLFVCLYKTAALKLRLPNMQRLCSGIRRFQLKISEEKVIKAITPFPNRKHFRAMTR